jgi:hypothetical protein
VALRRPLIKASPQLVAAAKRSGEARLGPAND